MSNARHCFYCGRPLKSGESCICRQAPAAVTPPQLVTADIEVESDTEPLDSWDAALIDPTPDPIDTPAQSDPASPTADRPKSRSPRQQKNRRSQAARRLYKARTERELHQISTTLRLFFTAPELAIESVRKGSIIWLIVLTAIKFMMIVYIGYHLLGRSNAGNWLIFAAIRPQNIDTVPVLITICALIEGMFILVLTIFKAYAYRFAIRLIGRQTHRYTTYLHAIAPGTFYFVMILFLACLTAMGTGIPSIFLVILGTFMALFTDFLSLKQLTGHNDNTLFREVGFALIMLCLVLCLFAQLLLPNLAAFTMRPISKAMR